MRRRMGLFWVAGFLGLVAGAEAQMPAPSSTGTAFDGTYRFVSSARVNKTFVTRQGQMGQCPKRSAGPLTVAQGQARYTSVAGRQLQGTVGPQGEPAMRLIAPPTSGGSYRPIEITVSGKIDDTGTVRARQKSYSCSYNFVWQKSSSAG
jgi:hypothetical protein